MRTIIIQKMKKSAYNSGLLLISLLLLLPVSLKAQEAIKEYHKEYTANENTILNLNNRYGDIIVETGDENQIVVNVIVTVKYPNEDKAQKLLSYIDINFSEEGNTISAKTEINDDFNFSGWSGESRKFTIDYSVKMPSGVGLTLSNKYGNTELDDLSGYVDLNIKYGDLTASKLTRGNEKPISKLNLAYGKAIIDEVGWLDATVRYASGGVVIEQGQALILDSKYSKINFGTISSLVAETKYDNVRIESINNLVLDSGYADVYIGNLSKKLVLDGGYGSFNIEDVDDDFESIEITTRYMGVRVGISESANYSLEAKTSYCGIKFNDDNFQTKRRIIENTSSEISGIVGTESSPSATVKIQSSYGSVKLY